MGRIFAGFLAAWALTICLLRGMINGSDPTQLLFSAWIALWVFAGIGYFVGRIAERITNESFQRAISIEAEAAETPEGLAANEPSPET